jgi:hypothetical protein
MAEVINGKISSQTLRKQETMLRSTFMSTTGASRQECSEGLTPTRGDAASDLFADAVDKIVQFWDAHDQLMNETVELSGGE